MINNRNVLLFEMNALKVMQIESVAKQFEINVNLIERKNYSESLGALLGITGMARRNKPYSGDLLGEEMMIMSGVDPKCMEQFLDALKSAGVSAIALKAMVTPTNVFWSPSQLYTEIKKEHELLHAPKNK